MADAPMVTEAKQRLRELRANKAKREEEEEREREARELEELELEERFSKELGKRGRDFEIVTMKWCEPIVLASKAEEGGFALYKRFMKANAGDNDPTPEDMHSYVFPCVVHPSKERFAELESKFPHIATRCANALIVLHGMKEKKDQGKY
ncbi:MAG TPA: hypothetical protein VF765_31095 [Polyangiaceae bacterium]